MSDREKIRLLKRTRNEFFLNIIELEDMYLTTYLQQFGQLLNLLKNRERAKQIWFCLLDSAETKSSPLVWLRQELDFELLVASAGDRKRMAIQDMRDEGLSDEALDRYNERMER